jgi:hypothetical protein
MRLESHEVPNSCDPTRVRSFRRRGRGCGRWDSPGADDRNTPGPIRTGDMLLRRQLLYPSELRGRSARLSHLCSILHAMRSPGNCSDTIGLRRVHEPDPRQCRFFECIFHLVISTRAGAIRRETRRPRQVWQSGKGSPDFFPALPDVSRVARRFPRCPTFPALPSNRDAAQLESHFYAGPFPEALLTFHVV